MDRITHTRKVGHSQVGRLPAQGMARLGGAVGPQGRMILPLLTLRENLETGFALLPRGERREPDEVYDLFPVPKHIQNRRGGDLSGSGSSLPLPAQ